MTGLQNFEDELRAMLAEVGAAAREPDGMTDRLVVEASRSRAAQRPAMRSSRRWLFPVLAAAAVIAVAAGAAAIVHAVRTDSHRPATQVPSPHPTSARFCITTTPPAWLNAISTALPAGSADAYPAAALSDGTLIVARNDVAYSSTVSVPTDLALVAPDGSLTDLLSAPGQAGYQVAAAADGEWAVLSVGRLGPATNREMVPYATLTQLVLYNGRTERRTAISLPSSGVVDGATVMDGTVYWDERASRASRTGRIVAYDTANGSTRVAWQGTFPGHDPHGQYAQPVTQAGGVYTASTHQFAGVLIAKRALPRAVETRMTPEIRRADLFSDGTSYAWVDPRGVLYWWQPGMSAPARWTIDSPGGLFGDDGAMVAVEGHWLFGYAGATSVLDLATGAMTTLPFEDRYVVGLSGSAGDGKNETSGGGFLFGYRVAAHRTQIIRLHPADLPELRC